MLQQLKKLIFKLYHATFNYYVGEIVTLHRITEWNDDRLDDIEELTVTPQKLQLYIDVRKITHDIISLDQLDYRLKHPNRKRPFLCITIDDGYKDNLTYGLPIFEKNKIPFALFVSTNFIDNKRAFNWPFIIERIIKKNNELKVENKVYTCRTLSDKSATFQSLRALILNWDYKDLESHFRAEFEHYLSDDVYEDILMSWEDIKCMSQSSYCTIGSHTLSHCRNSVMEDDDILREFVDSKRILEEKIGKSVNYIAYPYGCTTDVRNDIGIFAKRAGYKYGFTVGGIIRRKLKDVYRIPRLMLYNRDI